ncbi:MULTISPECIES: serine/threonine phosphatase [unclassified Leptolyngbya]|uniref:serine/threonine phosphatase n=1 Tax=unclassified Leptolyngbya TaxID=2650499 RepID=UPI001689ADAE|nr:MULTISPECIES: serine/threonine phosphatase [unclassified Leptolyngbya]MBD1910336.1 serine/threonine phosphatase [Leptolyngbya sp. FACHB-8]MBD2154861.1 serine/threonine phosphatase [Leptolyngbya sp. FACHB-16]
MLVCLECQFENPDNNRFCQKCGTSLTERKCLSCGAMVPVDLEACPKCHAVTGTFWRAVVQSRNNAVQSEGQSDSFPRAEYLDKEQRYQLLEPLPVATIGTVGADVRVLDCQPLRPSRLDLLCKEQDLPTEGVSTSTSEEYPIPTIALDYLELEQQLYPSLPTVRDAWEEGNLIIVLLEDRQYLLPMIDVWKQQPLAPFQILHLFHQMAELWTALQPRGYGDSLLQPGNLRIDEDQLLYLQRLFEDTSVDDASLKRLGQFWQQLLATYGDHPSIQALNQLCTDMIAELVATSEVLRSQLELIALALQNPPEELNTIPTPPAGRADVSEDTTQPMLKYAEVEPVAPVASDVPDTNVVMGATRLELNDSDEDDPVGESDDIPTIVLPMILVSLEEAGRSDVGRQRDHNEDFFCIQTEAIKSESITERKLQVKGLYILCDGMGGHASGEVASEMAAQTLRDYFAQNWADEMPSEAVIREGIRVANSALYEMNQKNDSSGSGRMGTTLVLVLVHGTQVAIAHVGDSRLYRFSRRSGLEQVTVDHEVGQREIQRGVEAAIAYARPDAYQLTQALGPRDEQFVNPDVQFLELNEDLLLLLCSDGLTDNDLLEKYCDSHIEPLLSTQVNLEQGVNALIDLANAHNGHDNITAVVVRARVRPNLAKLPRG